MKTKDRAQKSIVRSFIYFALAVIGLAFVTASDAQAADKISWQWVGNGMASDIDIGGNGKVWVLAQKSNKYGFPMQRWDGKWVATKYEGYSIAVDTHGMAYTVNYRKHLVSWNGSKPTPLQFQGNAIAFAPGGKAWIISGQVMAGGFKLYKHADGHFNINDHSWNPVSAAGTKIGVDNFGNAWFVNQANFIFRHDGRTVTKLPGQAKDIAVGADGTVWIVDLKTSNPMRWDGKKWVSGGTLKLIAIAVDPLGLPWGVGTDGKVWADKRSQSIKNVLVDVDKAMDAAQVAWKKAAAENLKKIAAAEVAQKKAEDVAAKKAAALAKAATYHGAKPPKGYILPQLCGGVGQPACQLSAAWYKGKVNRKKPSGAFFDPRKGGEYWKCPSNRPRRTLYAVTDHRACATKKLWPFEKLSPATFVSKSTYPKPAGGFVDIRKGGEYWSCPSGFWRNLNAVTGSNACTVNVGNNCDAGNIAIAGTLFKGEDITKYTCYKKLACGKENGRPCQFTERLPSCNKGLAEDFIDNKCINTTLAACLTGARAVKYSIKLVEGLTPLEKEIIKIVKQMSDDMISVIPGLKKAVQAGEKEMKKLATDAETAAKKELDKLLAKVKIFKKIEKTMETLAATVHKNKQPIIDLITEDDFCYMASHERATAMAKLLGTDLRKVKLAMSTPGPLDGLFIKSAHAATSPTSFSIGLSAGPTKDHITIGIGLDYVFDTTGKSAFYMSGSVGATTGGDSDLDVSLNVGIMPDTAYNDAGGSGISLGYSADFESAVSVSSDISMNLNWGDKKTPVSFGGVSLGFGEGGDTSSLSFSGSFSQSVLIADMK
jgi:hypothetical protein